MNAYPVTAWNRWFAWRPVYVVVNGRLRLTWLRSLERREVWATAFDRGFVTHKILTFYRTPQCSSSSTLSSLSWSKRSRG
jgi:hypothetical protein